MGLSVKEIVEKYLKENGYDGLYEPDLECGCLLKDGLCPCGECIENCRAGYSGGALSEEGCGWLVGEPAAGWEGDRRMKRQDEARSKYLAEQGIYYLDDEVRQRDRRFWDAACAWQSEQDAAEIARLRTLLTEVWDSVPASYDPDDPMVQRHARALNALKEEAERE